MADVAISGLPAAASVAGTDVAPVSQGATTRKATASQIATYVRSQVVASDVGLGNVDNTSDATKNAAAVTLTNKSLTSPAITTPTGIVKGDVGLGNVDNTSDANKPVSTATQTALDLKAPLASPGLTGAPTVSGTEPRVIFSETDQGTDLKLWDLDVQTGVFTLRTRTDADGAGVNALAVTRGTTTAIGNIALGNATNNPTGTWLGTGTFTFGGQLSVTGTYTSAAGNVTLTAGVLTAARVAVTGTTVPAVGIYRPGTDRLAFATATTYRGEFDANGQLLIATVGRGLSVAEGSNAKMGVATLAGGTVVVSTTAVTANSRILLTMQSLGTVTVPSGYGVSARTAGTSFTILSSAPTDTSVIAWMLVEPS